MSGKFQDYYAASGVKVDGGEVVPQRQDYRTLSKEQMYLYLEGLKRFQTQDPEDPLSWFQIAGIHGLPYQNWPSFDKEVTETGDGGGFCTHSSILFLTWHRPYLALFESALHTHVQAIADGIDDKHPEKQKYVKLAKQFRIPYWDWARKDNEPAPMEALLEDYRGPPGFSGPPSKHSVQYPVGDYNPLFKVTQPEGPVNGVKDDDLQDIKTFERRVNRKVVETKVCPTTVRYLWPTGPNKTPQEQLKVFYDTPAATGNSNLQQPIDPKTNLPKAERNLSERVVYILQSYSTYAAVSNNDFRYAFEDTQKKKNPVTYDKENWGSLEDIHNALHNLCGGGGNMSAIDKSAFDPIFWLHHTNIDRLFAIWQALHEKSGNPDSYVTPRKSKFGTFVTKSNTDVDSIETPLYPFKQQAAAKSWYTSEHTQRTEKFGYTYPETAGISWPPTDEDQIAVMQAIGDLYLPITKEIRKSMAGKKEAGMGFLAQAAVAKKIDANVPATVEKLEEIVSDLPSAEALLKTASAPGKPFLKDLAPDRKYLEWIVNIKALKHALDGKYAVHVFLGPADAEPDVALWPRAPTHVGTFAPLGQGTDTACAKCRDDQANALEVTGQIPLTVALVERYLAGIIEDLTPSSVVPYLQQNLHWRVVDGGEMIVEDQSKVDGLTLFVITNEVELPEDPNKLPIYAPDVEVYPEVTTNADGRSRGHGTGLTSRYA